MIITDVAWIRDHRQQLVLRLRIDGYLAHIPSVQRTELLRRGPHLDAERTHDGGTTW